MVNQDKKTINKLTHLTKWTSPGPFTRNFFPCGTLQQCQQTGSFSSFSRCTEPAERMLFVVLRLVASMRTIMYTSASSCTYHRFGGCREVWGPQHRKHGEIEDLRLNYRHWWSAVSSPFTINTSWGGGQDAAIVSAYDNFRTTPNQRNLCMSS